MIEPKHTLSGTVLDETVVFTTGELCRLCGLTAEDIIDMVAEGIAEPAGRRPIEWRFSGTAVVRIKRTIHLQRDLGVNLPGAALVLDLLEELEALRRSAP